MFIVNPKLKIIFLLGFLFSLQIAIVAYVNSTFLSTFWSEKNVSLIYICGSALSIFFLFFTPRILRKIGEYKFLLLTSGLSALSLLLLTTLKSSFAIILAFIFYFSLNYLIFFALDELLEIFSKNIATGKIRGFYLTTLNLAWIIAQIASGKILFKYPFAVLYSFGFVVMTVFLLVGIFGFKHLKDPKYDKTIGWNSFKSFFANKSLSRAYKIGFLLQFFYAWMVVYTPIYLHSHLGFNWQQIGIIFSIMLIPFVLTQFPLGKYSDKFGEKRMLIIGFLFTALSTCFLFFIGKNEIWVWALALFATRIGASTIEVMGNVYFFRHINKENEEFVAIYNNVAPISYLFSLLAAFLVFSLVPSFNYIFLILGIVMLYGVFLSSTIEKEIF